MRSDLRLLPGAEVASNCPSHRGGRIKAPHFSETIGTHTIHVCTATEELV